MQALFHRVRASTAAITSEGKIDEPDGSVEPGNTPVGRLASMLSSPVKVAPRRVTSASGTAAALTTPTRRYSAPDVDAIGESAPDAPGSASRRSVNSVGLSVTTAGASTAAAAIGFGPRGRGMPTAFASGLRYVERPCRPSLWAAAPPAGAVDFFQVDVCGTRTTCRKGRSVARQQQRVTEQVREHASEEDAVSYAAKELDAKLRKGYSRVHVTTGRFSDFRKKRQERQVARQAAMQDMMAKQRRARGQALHSAGSAQSMGAAAARLAKAPPPFLKARSEPSVIKRAAASHVADLLAAQQPQQVDVAQQQPGQQLEAHKEAEDGGSADGASAAREDTATGSSRCGGSSSPPRSPAVMVLRSIGKGTTPVRSPMTMSPRAKLAAAAAQGENDSIADNSPTRASSPKHKSRSTRKVFTSPLKTPGSIRHKARPPADSPTDTYSPVMPDLGVTAPIARTRTLMR